LRDRLFAYLPRYAPYAACIAPLMNLRNRMPGLAFLGEKLFGLSAQRRLPDWSSHPSRMAKSSLSAPGGGEGRGKVGDSRAAAGVPTSPSRAHGAGPSLSPQRAERGFSGPEVVLLVDTFNRYFEPENARAAERVLRRSGYRVLNPDPARGRPLCCGRTFMAAGLVDEARTEARRMLEALAPHLDAGTPIVGLEPSCLLTLRDEFPALLPSAATKSLAGRAQLFEEFAVSERAAGRFQLSLAPMQGRTALLHGHCHQKAFGTLGAAVNALQLIPGLTVETFDSTCCGMAGSFGYEAEHYEMSLKIGELGVLPKMRAVPPNTLLAANGTSCRHQIADAVGREARHLVRILDEAATGA
jgi:Fe-S oxidoreductase